MTTVLAYKQNIEQAEITTTRICFCLLFRLFC